MKSAKFYESLDDVISEICKKSELLYIKQDLRKIHFYGRGFKFLT